jgi:hypothetical protein
MVQAHAIRAVRMNNEFSAMFRPPQIRRPNPNAQNFCKLGNLFDGARKVGYSGESHRSGLKVSGSG